MAAALLASVATGCSSDVSRFGGLFSSSGQDNMTTSSVPRRTLFGGGGGNPVPRGDVGNGGQQYASGNQMGTRNEALKMAGNGVVPQQAAAAIRHLLERASA